MRIAIVDDSQADRLWLSKKLDGYIQRYELDCECYEYDSGEAFLAVFEAMEFDVVFMDIYMGGMNGLDAAGKLRDFDFDCQLVFLTSAADLLPKGYKLRAAHFLIKPVDDERLDQAMANCKIKPRYDIPELEVMVNRLPVRLNTGKIWYLDFCRHNTQIHMQQHTFQIRNNFALVAGPLLSDRRFLLCMKGLLVNMDKIMDVTEDGFLLKNGVKLPVSVKNKSELHRTYQSYMFGRLRGVQ